jgi:hypothetical protein
MKPKWLVETDVFDDNRDRLAEVVKRQGMDIEFATYIPSERDHGYLDLFDQNDCVLYYGSMNFAEQVQRESAWLPGVYFNRPAYECTHYYPKLGKYLLNSDYIIIPYGELHRQRDFLYEKLGRADRLFIRPNAGTKLFAGKVIERNRYEKDTDYLGFYGAESHDLCVVASPQNVEDEWRFVVADGRVLTGSRYIAGGKPDLSSDFPREAQELAEEVAGAGYAPDRAWCLDICRTHSGIFYLMEIGPVACSDWYACDLAVIVRELSRIAREDWQKAQLQSPH